jgi:hypothetical protein
MIKALKTLGIEAFLSIMKSTHDKPTANIILTGEKLKPIPPKSGTSQDCPHSPLFLNVVLEVLHRAL